MMLKNIVRWLGLAAVAALITAGCGPDPLINLGAKVSRAPRPLGSADGVGDAADTSCQVVLRSVGRIKNGPGYATTCSLGLNTSTSCLYVWQGQIDVAASATPASVELLYRTGQTGGQWYAVKAQPAASPSPGAAFVSYTFQITEHTPAAGMSMTSLNKTVIDLIPYTTTTAGGRLFDHNRVSDPFGSYRLDLANSWSVGADATVCPASPTKTAPRFVLDYPAFSEQLLDGPARAGGKLQISYDGRRLRETQVCMGAQGPVAATTLFVGYMFDNDGSQAKSAQVEQYVVSSGYACQGPQPCIKHEVQAPVLDLPAGATSIQLWFYCVPGFSGGSPGNWKYDSNMGQNYQLLLAAAANPPRAVDWAGAWRLHAARSGFTFPLPISHSYTGFTNMGWSVQAELYVKGLTDKAPLQTQLVKAYVESDMHACTPGGALTQVTLSPAASGAGSYANNALYRWGFEGLINSCPKGTYRYRFLFSADGGQTVTPLGAGDSTKDAGAAGFRTIVFQ